VISNTLSRVGPMLLALIWFSTKAPAASPPPPPESEPLRNRPELSKPLLDQRLILAHHMTAWIGYPDIESHALNSAPVPGGTAADMVGTRSTALLFQHVRQPALIDLPQAVLHEIRCARRMGLDGFQFFFPIHMHDGFLRKYSLIVKTFIQQAELHDPTFRVTLCLSAPTKPASESECLEQWAEHIRWLLKDTARSPIWLRSPDGRLIFYTWIPDGLLDPTPDGHRHHIHSRAGIAAAAVAYEKLARMIGDKIAYIYHLRGVDADWYANLIYDYFPAAWRWADGDMSKANPRLAALAQKRQRLFSPTVYPGFYGHTYRDHDGNPNGSGKVGVDPINELWRPYHKTGQTRLYRNLLESAIGSGSPLISFVTWNDVTEATHLMPGVNNNFAWGVLLNHYRDQWFGRSPAREIALVAGKKHRLDRPLDHDVGFRVQNGSDFGNLEEESRIEVLTILDSPATVHINGRPCGRAESGINSISVPFEAGPIRVSIQRSGREVIRLEPSEWSTDYPRRNDPVSFLHSSEDRRYFEDIYGPDARPYRLREYAPIR
jgi:hypothetical protein